MVRAFIVRIQCDTSLIKLLKTGNGTLFYNGMRVLYARDLQAITIAIRISHIVEYITKEDVNQCGYVFFKNKDHFFSNKETKPIKF